MKRSAIGVILAVSALMASRTPSGEALAMHQTASRPQVQPVTIRGVLVNALPVEDPGRSGWYLQRPRGVVNLNMSQAEQRPRRFQGQQVDLLGHWVRNEDGTRVFIVRRVRAT